MTTKEIALKTIEQLPENVSWEDIQARINFVVGVYKGLRELEEGKGMPGQSQRGIRRLAYQLIWAPSARLDLTELASSIAEFRTEASTRFIGSVFQVVERLGDFPESGRIVPEFDDPNIREVIRKPCRIVYRIKPQDRTVVIVRVRHVARGTPQL